MDRKGTAGCAQLIAALDHAVAAGGDLTTITTAVEQVLVHEIGSCHVDLPPALKMPVPGGYARRLIHHNEHLDYTAIAMVWGPGQGTPVHDHNGLWCVECVVEGKIQITQYDLIEQDGVRHRFVRQAAINAGVGSAGRLIPPYDYHTIENVSVDTPAITIHVYGGEMSQCATFQPLRDGWYQRKTRDLKYTAA